MTSTPIASVVVDWHLNGKQVSTSFELKDGVTALIGPSGAGKTTIARFIAGLEPAMTGQIMIGGQTLQKKGLFVPPQARSIGMVMQDPALFPTMTVGENIFLGAAPGYTHAIQQFLTTTETNTLLERMPQSLSGGEARRVAIVRALAAKPEFLILDEPMNGLDPKRRRSMMALIRRLAKATGTPVLLITHQLEEMLFAADHALLISEGCILESGSVEQVLSAAATAQLLGVDDAGSLLAAQVCGRNGSLLEATIGETKILLSDDGEPDGAQLRLRILARDVALAKQRTEGLSVLNQLSATVTDIREANADAVITLSLPGVEQSLQSRITAQSLGTLNIQVGDELFCLIKAVAVKELIAEV